MGTTSQKGYSFWKQADASPRHEATKGRQFDREFACREKSQERAAGSKHNKNKGRKMRRYGFSLQRKGRGQREFCLPARLGMAVSGGAKHTSLGLLFYRRGAGVD